MKPKLFYHYDEINNHPCCRMQEAVETFFQRAIAETDFSIDLFPEWLKATLNQENCKLDSKFELVFDLLHEGALDEVYRQSVYDQLIITNHIAELCLGAEAIPGNVIDWSSPIGVAIKALMGDLYDSLDLVVFRRNEDGGKPRHEFYAEFIKINKYVCPFCGLGNLKNKRGNRREDFDHYLHKAMYPFAAANMRNLIPTCGTCNQDYKKTKDILEDGRAFYPYTAIPAVKVEVNCETYPAKNNLDDSGKWNVNISLTVPDPEVQPMMQTWERVYSISQRYENEVAEFFDEWMQELDIGLDEGNEIDEDAFHQILTEARNKSNAAISRRMKPGEILRAAFYEFMISRAEPSFVESFRWQINRQQSA